MKRNIIHSLRNEKLKFICSLTQQDPLKKFVAMNIYLRYQSVVMHAAYDRLTSNEPFSQERIKRNSDESKHAKTHYAREKVRKIRRDRGPKSEEESRRVGRPVKGHASERGSRRIQEEGKGAAQRNLVVKECRRGTERARGRGRKEGFPSGKLNSICRLFRR